MSAAARSSAAAATATAPRRRASAACASSAAASSSSQPTAAIARCQSRRSGSATTLASAPYISQHPYRWRGLPDRRANQWMAEPQLGVDDRDQARLNRWIERGQCSRLTAKLRGGPCDFVQRGPTIERRREQHHARLLRQTVKSRRKRLLQTRGERRRRRGEPLAGTRRRRQSTGQLDKRKRVPVGLGQHAGPHDRMQIRSRRDPATPLLPPCLAAPAARSVNVPL